ncbi:hypothetical protein CLHOM_22890 [Clostridium homopropionicum DSM 5847]|uniref:N-acetyltransferase domain-containing protein n=1 Tax=Clostridium homopropionicum DSM 5847 TaxID=1121318 RepID=A0A0L6Z8U0_9CLOT|nr:GNAT family N-acetyltransferase [Clostridium homopropionicum]KOA19183.1 hypothetical protein CLHOM_22890 [Clostridium homopropionicum DSM 5847]SFG16713.1 Protein N-acetyltransferase, RimJ/RimL family [Clostridium homopropionicum]
MTSTKLESNRLVLKPLSFDELSYINDNTLEKIQIPIEQEALLGQTKLAISRKLDKMKNADKMAHEWFTYWLIIIKNNYKGIGFIGFKGIPKEDGGVEVGYSLSPGYREKGLMTEALSLLINWASKFHNCMGITATKVLKTNTGSNKVLINCKFILESSINEYNNYILRLK